MARDRANVRTDMWNDDDWRELSVPAQHLYLHLLSAPTLSYAGIADWRPARLSGMSKGATRLSIERAGAELVEKFFVVCDDETEEILVRSFLKYDGLLHKPNVAKAMVKAFEKTVSATLRAVIVHELRKLHDSHPELNAFSVPEVAALLSRPSTNAKELTAKGSQKGSQKGSEVDPSLLTTNYLLPTTDYSLPAKAETETDTTDYFAMVWKSWPKKDDRKGAKAKWKIAVEEFGQSERQLAEIAVTHAQAYAAYRTKQFTPALVVWLNKARWDNELPQPEESKQQSAVAHNLKLYERLSGTDSKAVGQ